MSDRIAERMNLKLNNDIKGSPAPQKSSDSLVKEERRRTGRYMAILVGISLFILALYHAWVRRIPIVASLVVPALIMFVYVAWILYTASREKHRFRLFDVEVGQAGDEAEGDVAISEINQNNIDATVISGKDSTSTPEEKNWTEISTALMKGEKNTRTEVELNRLPIILVNDKPPEDLDKKWLNIVELTNNEKLKVFHNRRRYKRKFCRTRRYAAFKRSYSIG